MNLYEYRKTAIKFAYFGRDNFHTAFFESNPKKENWQNTTIADAKCSDDDHQFIWNFVYWNHPKNNTVSF